MGYTTDYVMGVWAGNDNNAPMIDVTGVQGAAPIWHDAMLVTEAGRPIRDFAYPGGLEHATVTYPDGVKTADWFMPGTVPTFDQSNSGNGPGGIILPVVNQTSFPTDTNAKGRRVSSATPYYPGTYTFAFSPPRTNAQSTNSGWW